MKVTLEKNYKNLYTLHDLEIAKKVIAQEKEDEETPAGWAKYAVDEALKNIRGGHHCEKILEATATTAKNWRANNAYFDGSENMDIMIEATAKTSEGYIEIMAYLSDIFQSGAIDYLDHMAVTIYKRQK